MYKQTLNPDGGIANQVIRLTDDACIPFDPDNAEYQAYLKFIEDGGVPLPAEDIV